MRLYRLLCLLAVFLLSGTMFAQDYEKGFRFTNPRYKTVKIPFELINNLIIIPLQINNSENLHFIFDTGIRTAIITELPYNDSLSFSYNKVQQLQGLGEGRSIDAYPSYGNTISFDGIIGTNQDMYVLGPNDLNFSGRLGIRVNGIIGYDLIRDFTVEVNYQERYLVFHPKGSGPFLHSKGWFSLPAEIIDGRPFLRTNVSLPDTTLVDAKLLMDMGGGFALWISPDSSGKLCVPEPRTRTYLGYGLNGEIAGYIAQVQSIQLGPISLDAPFVAFPDSSSIGKVIRDEGRQGSIGAEILRRFNIVLDYEAKKVWFKPNHSFNDEFSFNRSGLEVVAPLPGAKVYLISRVEPGSAAALAGIVEGDQLIALNLKPAGECSMNDINAYFHGSNGSKLKLTLMRNGEIFKIRLQL